MVGPMRLPQVQYNTPVQSLGRYDPTLPMRSAGATAKAIQQAAGSIEDWARAEDDKNVEQNIADFNQRTEQLLTDLAKSPVINLDDYKDFDLGIDDADITFVTVQGDDGQEKTIRTVKKHVGLVPLFDKAMAGVMEEFSKRPMTPDGKAKFDLVTGETLHKANLMVIQDASKDHYAQLGAGYMEAHTKFIQLADADGAQRNLDSALAVGAISIETHTEKTTSLKNDIAIYKADIIGMSEDPAKLREGAINILTTAPDLYPAQRTQYFDNMMKRADKLEQESFDLEKKKKKEESRRLAMGHTSNMLKRGTPYTSDEMAELAQGLEKEDWTMIWGVNNSFRNQLKAGKEDDPKAFSSVTGELMRMFAASSDPPAAKRKMLFDHIAEATGINPETGQEEGTARLTAKQNLEARAFVDKLLTAHENNPAVQSFAEDFCFAHDLHQIFQEYLPAFFQACL